MNNKALSLMLAALCAAGVVWLCLTFPHTLRWIEGNSLFLGDGAYVHAVLSRPGGVGQLVVNFLYQFYRWPVGGALCFWLLVGCAALLLARLLSVVGGRPARVWALLLLPVAALCWLPDVRFALSAVLSQALLLVPLSLRRGWAAAAAVVLIALVGYALLPLLSLVLLVAVAALLAGLYRRRRAVWLGCAVALGLLAVLPRLWSDAVAFVPFAERLGGTLAGTWPTPLWALPALVAVLAVVVRFLGSKLKPWLVATASAVATVGALVGVSTSNNLRGDEHYYRLSNLADAGEWTAVKDEIDLSRLTTNPIDRAYAMLADAALGTLWQHLFTYPIASSEDFLFRHETAPFYLNFNRQFYARLGVPDEALHMAFEYGVQTDNGLCMKSLRDMTDYALDGGDLPLARKYMHLLGRTTLHGAWLQERLARLVRLQRGGVKSWPDRTDTFIGGYPFNSEMVRLCEQSKGDARPYNYLLAGLLLDKELDKFALILRSLPVYAGRPMPRSFAEGAAMVVKSQPAMRAQCQYDAEVDRRFNQFLEAMQSGGDVSAYTGTYWHYYFYTQPATTPAAPGQ